MEWIENEGDDYIRIAAIGARCDGGQNADNLRFLTPKDRKPKTGNMRASHYQGVAWKRPRKSGSAAGGFVAADLRARTPRPACARMVDIRYVVTSLKARRSTLTRKVYGQRGQMETLITLTHKDPEASDKQSRSQRDGQFFRCGSRSTPPHYGCAWRAKAAIRQTRTARDRSLRQYDERLIKDRSARERDLARHPHPAAGRVARRARCSATVAIGIMPSEAT